MLHRDFHPVGRIALVAGIAMLAWWLSASAFAAGMSEEDVPATSIVPAEGPGPSPATAAGAPSSATSPPSGSTYMPAPKGLKPVPHHVAGSNGVHGPEIEPAQARLKVVQEGPVYSAPAKSSKHIEQLTHDKFVTVIGSTHYFLQVKLKNGQTGYIEPSSVELVKPTDKIFMLSHNAGVVEKPNRWAKKVAEVHQGHNVHVVGISLNYIRIRMKNGLEGFIPMTAVE